MLDLKDYSCSVAGVPLLRGITFTVEVPGITAIVGRSGSGTSTLVRALAGDLPAQAVTRGSLWLNNRRIGGEGGGDLGGTTLLISDAALPGGTVADCLRLYAGDLLWADGLGLREQLTRSVSSLPLDLRLRLHCANLMAQDCANPPTLVLVDHVLSAADHDTRDRFCRLLEGLAAGGATVLWATHDLDAVWEHADHVVELIDAQLAWVGNTMDWHPQSIPEPTLKTLARALHLPPTSCRTPAETRIALDEHGASVPLFPVRSSSRPAHSAPGTMIDASAVGLTGRGIEVRPGECLGIIDLDGRPEALARALIGKLPQGDVVPTRMPRTLRLRSAARTWQQRHRVPAKSALWDFTHLHPYSLVADLDTEDFAAFRRILATVTSTPLWLPHPQTGLDPVDRHTFGQDLRHHPTAIRIVTSRDIEFLVRACHRLLVIRDHQVIGDGSPGAVAEVLPTVVSRAVGSHRYLRLTDVLQSTSTQVYA